MSLSRLFCRDDSAQQIANKLIIKSDRAQNRYIDHIMSHYNEPYETLAAAKEFIQSKHNAFEEQISPSINKAGALIYAMRSMSSVDAAIAFIKSHENNGYSLEKYFRNRKLSIDNTGRKELLSLSRQIDKHYTKTQPLKEAIQKIDHHLSQAALRNEQTVVIEL